MIGQTIAHYKIVEHLGSGGMGEVYLATDTKLDRQVALKFLPAAFQKDPEARERLVREAKAASKLNHKNILTIYAVESVQRRDFIVMEYVDGQSLREALDSGEPLPIGESLRVALQVCDGLAAAHEQGIVHRDIKPANILFTAKKQVKITDFGLATWRGASQLTKEGTTVGTAAYMSPEQIQGKKVDPRSDLFSLGVVLYEMIAGRKPFAGEHDAAISYSIMNDAPEPLARFKSNVNPLLEQTVTRALEKDPSMRYQSATDMLAELKRARREIEGSQPSMVSKTMPAKPGKPYLKYVVASSVVFVIALVLLILKPFKFDIGGEQKATASDNSLAVLYFDNVTDPADTEKMAQMITSLLITDLSESRIIKVVSRQRLYDILKQLGHEGETRIDRNTATEVAQRAGVRRILTGEIIRTEPNIVLASEIADVKSGEVVSSQRVDGEPGEDLFAAVDKLGAEVRADLAPPGQLATETDRPIADMTTHSQQAYWYYLNGINLADKFYLVEAIAEFKRALALDSTMAMAFCYLSYADHDRRVEWAREAMDHVERATASEAYLIRGRFKEVQGDYEGAIREYSQLIEREPANKDAYVSRGFAYYQGLNDYRSSISDYLRVIEIDPTYKFAYNMLAYSYQRTGDLERALWAINEYIAMAPGEANPYDTRGDLHVWAGQVEQAMTSYAKALEIKPDFPSWTKLAAIHIELSQFAAAESLIRPLTSHSNSRTRSSARLVLALIPIRQGDFRQAIEIFDQGIAADRLDQYSGEFSVIKRIGRAGCFLELGQSDSAFVEAKRAVELTTRQDRECNVAWRDLLIELLAQTGQFDEAQRLLSELEKDVAGCGADDIVWLDYARGITAYWQGNYPEAVNNLEKADFLGDEFTLSHALARAYLQNNQLGKSVAVLERCLSSYDEFRLLQDPILNVTAHYYLAQAYEKSGWNDKAAEEYEKFLGIWHKADPNHPLVAEARNRLMKLRS